MDQNEPVPNAVATIHEELHSDLPPPQLISTDRQSSSNSLHNLQPSLPSSSAVILKESSEGTREDAFRQQREDQQAKIAAFLDQKNERQPERKDIIIEEKEATSEMVSDTYSNRMNEGSMTRVIDNII